MVPQNKHVVTSFIQSQEKLLLLQRSCEVGTDQRKWATVCGYLTGDDVPVPRALSEIREQTGLTSEQVTLIRSGELLRTYDDENDVVRVVHPLLFETHNPIIHRDWKHDGFTWINPNALCKYDTVPKLRESFERVRWDLQNAPEALSSVIDQVDAVRRDHTHGASYLGSRAVQIVGDAARLSDATNSDDLFRDLLNVILRLQQAQPSMATLRNLLGRLLYRVDSKRAEPVSAEQLRQFIGVTVDAELSTVKQTLNGVSKNCLALLGKRCKILTHSYSSTVRQVLELAFANGKQLEVYATQSLPGSEGERLVNDLVSKGIRATLIPDPKELHEFPRVDLVLVGADSVMTDGSVVNKIGTRDISALSYSRSIPFYVVCETAKFSTIHFLGQPISLQGIPFDLTPCQFVTRIVSEMGELEPHDVERQIKSTLRELYT